MTQKISPLIINNTPTGLIVIELEAGFDWDTFGDYAEEYMTSTSWVVDNVGDRLICEARFEADALKTIELSRSSDDE